MRYPHNFLPIVPFLSLAALCPAAANAQARAGSGPPKPQDMGFCKPYNWLSGGWVNKERMPLLADINGDGYADLMDASPAERIIDFSLNGKGWKPMRGGRLLSDLPERIQSMAAGRLGGKGMDIAVLGAGGTVSVALNRGAGQFDRPVTICKLDGVAGKAWLFAGRVYSGSLDDLVVVDSTGRVQVVSAAGKHLGGANLALPVVDAAAGDVTGAGKISLAVRSASSVSIFSIGKSTQRIAAIEAPPGQEALAVGDINADGKADVLVDGKVYLAPGFKSSVSIPGWSGFTKPVVAMMGDMVHHGRADVLVQHLGDDYFGSTETDCDLYITYFKSDPDWDCDGLSNADEIRIGSDPLDRSTSHDGIPDGWKEHGFDGVDLKAAGASPLHKDVFVMNLIQDNVSREQVERRMRDEIVPFFARIPYKNLDGTQGFAIHWITQTPPMDTKADKGKSWQQIAGERMPKDKIGLYHWMLVGGLGGGGQSDQLADSGSSGMGSWAHEFGHQLGLSHSGKYPIWAPTYTSLMNYSYSYQFDGDSKKVHFSTGELAALVLNESHLPGKVPYPIEKLKFLEGPPYHLHLKAADACSTYIDWGWTGQFSDKTVRANITFGYGVSGGERLQPSGTKTFNYDGPYELMTDYQASLCEYKGKLYMVTANRPPVDPNGPRPISAGLVIQTYQGRHAWSAPVKIGEGVTNDPYAASDGRFFYVFYPTADGVMYRYGTPEDLSEPQMLPETKGAYVSALNWHGTLNLFIYKDKDTDIACRTLWKQTLGPVVDMNFKSAIPVGPAVDTIKDQLLLGTAAQVGDIRDRWQLRRFEGDGTHGYRQVSESLVGGEKQKWYGNRRPTLIFDASPDHGPDGKIYWIAAGDAEPLTKPTGMYVAQTIGYHDVNDGWLLWRYYDEWTNTRSGMAAAWFDNNITLATTWASGTAGGDCGVFCAYNGTTIGNEDMGDYDDVSLMANYGMSRSIGTFAEMPAVGAAR